MAVLGIGEGRAVLHAEELDRIDIRLADRSDGRYIGFARVGDHLAPLPVGSRLEGSTFTWQLGAGFIGAYDFVFVREDSGATAARQEIQITIYPQGTFTRPQVVIDTPESGELVDNDFTLAGWTLDPAAAIGTGISRVHVWAYPVRGGAPIFLGNGTTEGRRSDVALVYGDQFRASGFGLITSGLAPDTYDLAIFAWSDSLERFLPAQTVRVSVR